MKQLVIFKASTHRWEIAKVKFKPWEQLRYSIRLQGTQTPLWLSMLESITFLSSSSSFNLLTLFSAAFRSSAFFCSSSLARSLASLKIQKQILTIKVSPSWSLFFVMVYHIIGQSWVWAPPKALVASSTEKLYPHCFVLDNSRNGFDPD